MNAATNAPATAAVIELKGPNDLEIKAREAAQLADSCVRESAHELLQVLDLIVTALEFDDAEHYAQLVSMGRAAINKARGA